MIRKLGLKLGGLQHKILNLLLIVQLAVIGVFAAVSIYQAMSLAEVVSNARTEQEKAIKSVSGSAMHQFVDSSMTRMNVMHATISDDMFSDIKADVLTLQTLAVRLLSHADDHGSAAAEPPDPSKDGTFTAQVLCEAGVDPSQSELLDSVAPMSETMVAMCESSEYLTNCFIGLDDGVLLCVDDNASAKFDENGVLLSFPVHERPWYKAAVEAGELCFTALERDTYTDRIGVECVAPVYVGGKLVGVVGADLFLDAMAEYVHTSEEQGSGICVISHDGQVIFAAENNKIFKVQTSDQAEDLRKQGSPALSAFITDALNGQTGLRTIPIDGKEYFMVGSPISTVGWTVISFIEKDITEQPAIRMMTEHDRINAEASAKFEAGTKNRMQALLIIIALILIYGSASALILAEKVVRPVERMTRRISEIDGTVLTFEMEDSYKTGDEIEVLARSFAALTERTREYITEITRITAEKERISAELELATRIQADMLPNTFPAFPDRSEFDIYATMTPAKEVGGDFYDFFFIDDDHLGLVIADVSGKGVPAALFMMMSKILVSNFAMMGASPAKVLEQVNAQICQNNKEEMFVTVWLGILEISTGKVTAANAGHEYPLLRKADGEFELFEDKHSFVVGGIKGIRYKEYEFLLEKGGTLFLYTDGVPEASNADEVLFGTDRMLEALNRDPLADPRTLLRNMKQAVDDFVGTAPQFDDLTMLSVKLL